MRYFCSCCICSVVLFIGEVRPVSTEDASKYVCSGESIQLFENIIIDSINMVVSLSVSASKHQLIAMWTLLNATIADGYTRKVFRDQYGDIWIRNVSPSDQAHYTLMCGIGSSFVTSVVHLSVLTAPTMNCKPKIKRVDDIMSASLEDNNCGKPIASVYWLDYPGIYYEGKDLVKLSPKDNAGTYYACIEGPAVRCAKTSKFSDYCSAFTIEGSHDIGSESGTESSLSKYSLVMLIIILMVLILVLFVLFMSRRTNFTQCRIRKKTKDVGKSEYDAIVVDTELSDRTVDQKKKIRAIPPREDSSS